MKTLEQLWDNFAKYLAENEPLGKPDDKGVFPAHKNMIGSMEKYKRLFLQANTVPQGEAVKKIKPLCPTCDSDKVVKDATAVWDVEQGEWVLSNVFDDSTCENCGDIKIRSLNWEEQE